MQASQGNPDLLTWQEALDFLRCSDGTLRRYIKEGRLKRIKPRGRVYLSKADLVAFLQESKQ